MLELALSEQLFKKSEYQLENFKDVDSLFVGNGGALLSVFKSPNLHFF